MGAVFNLAGAVMGSGIATDGLCIELRTPEEADSIIAQFVSYAVPRTQADAKRLEVA